MSQISDKFFVQYSFIISGDKKELINMRREEVKATDEGVSISKVRE